MWNEILDWVEDFGNRIRLMIIGVGKYTLLLKSTGYWAVRRPFRIGLLFKQLEFVGNQSFSIIFLSGLFTGAVLGLQIGKIFGIFKAEGMMGAATGKSLALELAPVMCGFIVSGRAGASMAAEIGTMRVNEQLDAMEAMGVDPVSYLVVPRILAATIMVPVLSIMFLGLGIVGCYLIGVGMFSVDTSVFFQQIKWLVWVEDIHKGAFKATMFGFILSSASCYKGYFAKGGAKGVGEATTQAVVVSLLAILISDFFVSLIQLG